MKRSVLHLLLALLLLVALPSSVAARPVTSTAAFADVPVTDEATQAFGMLRTLRIIEGFGGERVGPDLTLTRTEFAKIAITLMGYERLAEAMTHEASPFLDAAAIPAWGRGYVNAAHRLGVVQGRPSGVFDPMSPVSFVESLVMLTRALGYGHTITGDWPAGPIQRADELGITEGIDWPHLFANPLAAITRREMAMLTASTLTIAPPDGSSIWEQRSVQGVVEALSDVDIRIGETTYQLASHTTFVGARQFSDLKGIHILSLLNPEGQIGYLQEDSRFRISGHFQEWNEHQEILFTDGRMWPIVAERELTFQINHGDNKKLRDPGLATFDDLKKYFQEGDEIRINLNADGEVHHVELFRDTYVDAILSGIFLPLNSTRSGNVSLRLADTSINYLVTDATWVTLNGVTTTLQQVEMYLYDDLDHAAVATVRAHNDDPKGGLHVPLSELAVSSLTRSGIVQSRGEDEWGTFVMLSGSKVYYDENYLSFGIGQDMNTGNQVTLLLGTDYVARAIIR